MSWVALTLSSCEPRPLVPPAPVPTVTRPEIGVSTPPTSLELPRGQGLSLLCTALSDRDHDCDRRITVADDRSADCSAARSNCPQATHAKWPHIVGASGVTVELAKVHEAAQFVQELVVELRKPNAKLRLDLQRVRLDPASYLAYRIEHHYWDALTRQIDADPVRLATAAADVKLGSETSSVANLCPTHETKCALRRPLGAVPNAQPLPPPSRELHVYYPIADPNARVVFEKASVAGSIAVHALPEKPTTAWLLETTRAKRHGLLTLALGPDGNGRPFVVPGGRFNEMYGWDSFFIAWGLVQSPNRVELARSIVENQAYEIARYGKILNANRTYYLTRSQPPFFTTTIAEVWKRLPNTNDNRRWLEGVLTAAIREYRTVWSSAPRRLGLCEGDVCLARYFGEGRGEPPEVEAGHFDWFYQSHALSHGHCRPAGADATGLARFLECTENLAARYRSGELQDREIDDFFANDQCVRESGHDTTFRWFEEGKERCGDFATVDLNALLFKYEVDIATLLSQAFGGKLGVDSADAFCARAKSRARLVEKYLWDADANLFFDYDTKRKRRSRYLSATTLYPLWASEPNRCGATLVTPAKATALKAAALRELEAPGGLLATSPTSAARAIRPKVLRRAESGAVETVEPGRQWEAPNGWAPHQMLAWVGLRQMSFETDAQRLAYRWLYTIVNNAASYHGTVPEKFDVVARSHAVFQEYGNVNTEFAYIADEGFGWMNASFVVGWRLLNPELREALRRVVPPEQAFRGN